MGIIGKRAYRLTCPQCGAAETADTSSTLAKTEALVINGLQKEKNRWHYMGQLFAVRSIRLFPATGAGQPPLPPGMPARHAQSSALAARLRV
jgi:hypothetical protein